MIKTDELANQKKIQFNRKLKRGTSLKSKREILKIKKQSESYKKQEKLIKTKLLKLKHNTNKLKKYQRNIFFDINLRKFNQSLIYEKHFNKKSTPYIMGFLDNNIDKMFINLSIREKTKKSWKKLKIIQKLGGFSRKNKKSSLHLKRKSIKNIGTKNIKKKSKDRRKSFSKLKLKIKNVLTLPNLNKQLKIKFRKLQKIPVGINKLYKNYNTAENIKFPLETKALTNGGIFKSNFIISGGICNESSKRFQSYNFINHKSIFIENEIFERYNHLTVFESFFMIINGGVNTNTKKLRNDTYVVNLQNNQFFRVKNFNITLPSLKNHTGFYHDNKFYLEGGIGSFNRFETKFYRIDLISYICTEINLKNKKVNLAHHKSVKVGIEEYSDLKVKYSEKENIKKNTFFKKNRRSTLIEKNKKKINLEGVYIFGGIDKNNKCYSNLKIYKKLIDKNWEIIYPSTKGFIPARFDHEMVYINKIKSIAICGGRSFLENEEKTEIFLNDLYILNTKNLCYFKIRTVDETFKRYGFTLSCFKGDLFIFGGMREDNFIDGLIVKYSLNTNIMNYHIEFFF